MRSFYILPFIILLTVVHITVNSQTHHTDQNIGIKPLLIKGVTDNRISFQSSYSEHTPQYSILFTNNYQLKNSNTIKARALFKRNKHIIGIHQDIINHASAILSQTQLSYLIPLSKRFRLSPSFKTTYIKLPELKSSSFINANISSTYSVGKQITLMCEINDLFPYNEVFISPKTLDWKFGIYADVNSKIDFILHCNQYSFHKTPTYGFSLYYSIIESLATFGYAELSDEPFLVGLEYSTGLCNLLLSFTSHNYLGLSTSVGFSTSF